MIFTLLAALFCLYVGRICWVWRNHYLAAKATGLTAVLVPFHFGNDLWQLYGNQVTLALQNLLPGFLSGQWLNLNCPMQSYHEKYTPYERFGTDAFFTVSPGGPMLWVSDPDVINQITTRRSDFVKPIETYGVLDIYGKNVVTTEGQYWRHIRKIVAPPFSSRNNRLVWSESLVQARNLIYSWTDGITSRTIKTAEDDMTRLSLYVISKAVFGRSLPWPGLHATEDTDESVKAGYKMTFSNAIRGLLDNIWSIVVFTPQLLGWMPFASLKTAYQAFEEWGKYMNEIYDEKTSRLKVEQGGGADLMSLMVKAAQGTTQNLSREEVMGNAFIMILAGHETTAELLHFSLVLLAQNIATQRRLQAELDSILGSRKPEEWSYETDVPKLFGSLIGASMAEELRLFPSVPDIPKTNKIAQMIFLNGKEYVLPANTFINLSASAVHRNAKHWPSASANTKVGSDINKFKPERWLKSKHLETSNEKMASEPEDDLALVGDRHLDIESTLLTPVKGSYIPFSEGHRSCLGRRFAAVEYVAVLATIFQEWSVELAVDDLTTEDVERMNPQARREIWDRANLAADETFKSEMTIGIALRLKHGKHIPLRLVRRGEELFDWDQENP